MGSTDPDPQHWKKQMFCHIYNIYIELLLDDSVGADTKRRERCVGWRSASCADTASGPRLPSHRRHSY